ncbi:unnamed protein product [Euphydryas editha]|uniref:RNA-directed DNA polymerase n=1 Tax=Euphydryas editha TaxID=104508 RepID=A0AAU9TIM7_EUPED|nr:unnamed protein product [Euphydryas editha]
MSHTSDRSRKTSSEVGYEGSNEQETTSQQGNKDRGASTHDLLSGMESILTRLLAATTHNTQPSTQQHNSTLLVKFDPDDAEADIEGWCRITEIIVSSQNLTGTELLLALVSALKGRAASCLTKLKSSEIEWPRIKELLLARFGRPMLMQDYFDSIMRFEITQQETASEAAMRLWSLIERIPRVEMNEEVITGFVISVLSQRSSLIRRELNSYTITTRAQLYRALSGISLKRRLDENDEQPSNSKKLRVAADSKFGGSCHYCGHRGHKIEECRKRRDGIAITKVPEREKTVTCFTCQKPGHVSTACPNNKADSTKKDVNICDRNLVKGTLSTSTGKSIPFLFDSGSACSLIKNSVAALLLGPIHKDTVYLTGIGGEDVKCTTQISSLVRIQNIPVSILFHVVPDNTLVESVIIGRDILNQGFHVEINSDSIRFSSRKSINTCQTSSRLDFSSIDTDLEGEKKEQLFMILSKYSEYFIEGMPIRRVTTGELKIDLIDPHKTVQRRPHQMSPSEKAIVREKIQSLLDADIIRESSSPFASPIVLVKKKDGTDRLCVDYRELNANTRPEHYPLPRIEEQVDRLNGAHFFSSLDMAAGYHQVRVSPESIKRTAFVTPEGQFEYLAMPFGLRNAASTYQRCINKALKSLKDTVALAYMDDVLSYSSSVDEGLHRLDTVLQALTEAGFSLKMAKPNPGKVRALLEVPYPKTARQVRQFLGLASYFRRFIPNFANIASPLYPLTKLKGRITWTQEHSEAHRQIVKVLSSKSVLTIFDPDKPVELHTDASSDGYGAVLIQRDQNVPHVVAYFSRRTTEIESRYHSYELETLAVVRAVESFRHYLYGQHFTVYTDCNSLKASKAKTDLSPRVHRWWAFLQAYDFDIIYKEGRHMAHADFLSRNPLPAPSVSGESSIASLDSNTTHFRKSVNFVELHNSWIQVEQKRDQEIQNLISQHEKGELPGTIAHTYDVRDGILYRKVERNKISTWLPIVPRSLVWTLINHVHTEIKHLGHDKTLNKLYEQYWFPQMSKNVQRFIDSCIVCKASKGISGAQQVRLHPIPKVSVPWHTVHIDMTGKLSGKSDRNEYASVIIDAFTKYVLLEYTQSLDSACAVKALKKAVCLFGSPQKIIADRGRCFISTEFKEFCTGHNIELHLIATGSARANGQVERVMRTLKNLLTIVENDTNKVWRDELDEVQLALNSTRSRVTGFTPTELMFGIRAQSLGMSQIAANVSTPSRADLDTIRNQASANILEAASSQEQLFNRGKARIKPFNLGDHVFVKCSERNQTKLSRKFKGPFVITKILDNDRYELKSMNRSSRIYKYSHENLREIPRGFEGLVEISTTLINDEDDVSAIDENGTDLIESSDTETETASSASENTLTASSGTLSASEEDFHIVMGEAQVHRSE